VRRALPLLRSSVPDVDAVGETRVGVVKTGNWFPRFREMSRHESKNSSSRWKGLLGATGKEWSIMRTDGQKRLKGSLVNRLL
jgi:hypothetical protein